MDYLNGLGYKWVHYGTQLFGNHVRRIDGIGICRDNWPPQGNRNTADKLLPGVWLINSVTDHGPDDTYYCWFFTTIDHERRSIFYTWIKGDLKTYTWSLRDSGKNTRIIFHDCDPGAPSGYYDGTNHIITLEPLLQKAAIVVQLD